MSKAKFRARSASAMARMPHLPMTRHGLCVTCARTATPAHSRISATMTAHATKRPLSASRSNGLKGEAAIPGDKSISHRSVLFGGIASGQTRIEGLLEGEDVLNSIKAVEALGARARKEGGTWIVEGTGNGALLAPLGADRFRQFRHRLPPVHGPCRQPMISPPPSSAIPRCRKRPMGRVLDPLRTMGCQVLDQQPGGRLPVTIRGAREAEPGHLHACRCPRRR